MQQVRRIVEEFLQGGSSETLLIRGDAGSGKTLLKDALVKGMPSNVVVLQSIATSPNRTFCCGPGRGLWRLGNLVERERLQVPRLENLRLNELFPQMDMGGDREAGLAGSQGYAQGGCGIPYFVHYPGGSGQP